MKIRFRQGESLASHCQVHVSGHRHPLAADAEGQVEVSLQTGPALLEVVHHDARFEVALEIPDLAQRADALLEVDLRTGADSIGRFALITTGGVHVRQTGGERRVLRGRYEIRELVGEGGMGRVYRARDLDLGREVAIKVLSAELAAFEEAREIFAAEARSLAGVNHPNLIAVYDVFREDDQAAMVMEFVRGRTVEAMLGDERGGLALDDALDITAQLLVALAYLQERGVVHRDIKPSNMMVDEQGQLRLMDFGLARSLDAMMVRGTRVRGTPAYMAPEQVLGDELSPATDLYGACATLFEVFTGRLPFESGDIAYHHVHVEPPDPRPLRPELPEAIATLIVGGMAKVPSRRPGPLIELVAAVAALIEARGQRLPSSVQRALNAGEPRTSGPILSAPRELLAAAPALVRTADFPSSPTPSRPRRAGWAVGVAAMLLGLVAAVVGLAELLVSSAEPAPPRVIEAVQAPDLVPEPHAVSTTLREPQEASPAPVVAPAGPPADPPFEIVDAEPAREDLAASETPLDLPTAAPRPRAAASLRAGGGALAPSEVAAAPAPDAAPDGPPTDSPAEVAPDAPPAPVPAPTASAPPLFVAPPPEAAPIPAPSPSPGPSALPAPVPASAAPAEDVRSAVPLGF